MAESDDGAEPRDGETSIEAEVADVVTGLFGAPASNPEMRQGPKYVVDSFVLRHVAHFVGGIVSSPVKRTVPRVLTLGEF
jgi:hypothetical protein